MAFSVSDGKTSHSQELGTGRELPTTSMLSLSLTCLLCMLCPPAWMTRGHLSEKKEAGRIMSLHHCLCMTNSYVGSPSLLPLLSHLKIGGDLSPVLPPGRESGACGDGGTYISLKKKRHMLFHSLPNNLRQKQKDKTWAGDRRHRHFCGLWHFAYLLLTKRKKEEGEGRKEDRKEES